MANWHIGRRVAACSLCEKEFQNGAALYSLLRVSEAGLERADLCLECHSDEALAGSLFWWRTRHQVEEQRGLKLDFEAIEALFVALDPYANPDAEGEEGEPKVAEQGGDPGAQRLLELRYLLCLILLRKRRLKVTKVARSYKGVEGEFFLVKRPRRDEQLAVAVFDFDGDKIALLQKDLQRIFEGADPSELSAEAPEPGPEEEAEAALGTVDPD